MKSSIECPSRIFSRNEFIRVVQGCDFEGYSRTIDSQDKILRKKTARSLQGKEVIRTIHGMGCKLNDQARRVSSLCVAPNSAISEVKSIQLV